jgi:hypothetical protein
MTVAYGAAELFAPESIARIVDQAVDNRGARI